MPPSEPMPTSRNAVSDSSLPHHASTTSIYPDSYQPYWNDSLYDLSNANVWGTRSSLTHPWLDPTLHAAQQDDTEDLDLVEEESDDGYEDDGVHNEAMPDIQRGSLFESTSDNAREFQRSPLAETLEAPHRPSYADAIYGDSTWSSSHGLGPIVRPSQPSLRRTVGLTSAIRNRRADLQPRVRTAFPIVTDSSRTRSTSPGRGLAEQRENTLTPAGWRMDADRGAEYTGWAPGTATEHQRPTLNMLQRMARGSATPRSDGRSPAMTALERRYWAEQERQRRHRAIVAGEQEAASRRIQVRDSTSNAVDEGAEAQNPRSVTYARPDRLASTRTDIYDLHRDMEEMQQDEDSALSRRARRELRQTRRAHPLDEVRRDELRRGLYDLHRDKHAEGSEPTRRCIEEAIKYLEKLRKCDTSEQAYRAAEEGGLIRDGRAACNLADFVFDSKVIGSTPWTSWLQPGTKFSGFQHAVTTSALPYTIANSGSMRISRIPTATASSNPNSSTFRPSWIESVIQRDRHSGAGSTAPMPSLLPLATQTRENEDTWPVKVTITSVDYEKCTLTGTMEAMNVPNKTGATPGVLTGAGPDQTTITTFLEGEIIDLNHHSLETCGFNADSVVDSTYWRRLEPFKSLNDNDMPSKLVSSDWLSSKIGHEWVLMRWKEKCFVTPSDAGMGLTISGFYYISLHRATGKIEGLYYDPMSSPLQHLRLEPSRFRQFSGYKFQ